MSDPIHDSYLTFDAPCAHEIKVKDSRFIALGYPVSSETSASGILGTVRKKEYAASHHCYAYVLAPDGKRFKYSDDGEPSGTAGRPIYQSITGANLFDVLIIVVRYFGGTKLGTGGLTRAYAQAAADLLRRAHIVETLLCDRLRFTISFPVYDRIVKLVHRGGYQIVSQDFADLVTMQIDVRKSRTAEVIAELTELTGGRIDVTIND